jgi:hypothetical protein
VSLSSSAPRCLYRLFYLHFCSVHGTYTSGKFNQLILQYWILLQPCRSSQKSLTRAHAHTGRVAPEWASRIRPRVCRADRVLLAQVFSGRGLFGCARRVSYRYRERCQGNQSEPPHHFWQNYSKQTIRFFAHISKQCLIRGVGHIFGCIFLIIDLPLLIGFVVSTFCNCGAAAGDSRQGRVCARCRRLQEHA